MMPDIPFKHILAGGLVLLTAACAVPEKAGTAPAANDAYAAAIRDAAVIEPGEAVALPVIRDDTARVVTWTSYPDSYTPGDTVTLSWGVTWVTLDGAVKKRCSQFPADSRLSDTQKLLGLPEKAEDRYFVTLSVDREHLFRPCADPDLKATTCGAEFPDDVSKQHRQWYAGQSAASYHLPGGFPWTRLGYTYNWKTGAGEVGPAEFVIRKDASVEVLSVEGTAAYCSH